MQFAIGPMYICKNKHVFRHLKPEIALSIPALNEWIKETNISSGHGLK